MTRKRTKAEATQSDRHSPQGEAHGQPEGTVDVGTLAVTIGEAWCKDALGWTTDPTHVKTGFLFDDKGEAKLGKVWCSKNTRNRWCDMGLCYKYGQDQLLKRWKLNGEAILFGESGEVVSGQKRLIGNVIANALLRKFPHRYGHLWPEGEVTFRSVVIGGVSEDHDTLRTVDNVQPRSLADVIYTELGAFKDSQPGERRVLTKMTENGLKCLWSRMGVKDDIVEYLTHSEAVDFLKRHRRLFDAVQHVHDEDGGNIKNYIGPGYASGLLYLFGASDTAGEDYFALESLDRSEKLVNFDRWDKACEFFTLFANGGDFQSVREAISALNDPDTMSGGRLTEKETIIIKAWNHFKEGEETLVDDPPIKYIKVDGAVKLGEWPVCGGLDIGKAEKKGRKKKTSEGATPTEASVTMQDVKKERDAALHLATAINETREAHLGKLLLWEGDKKYHAWGQDAETVTDEFGMSFDRKRPEWGDLKRVTFKEADFTMNVEQLQRAGKKVAVVSGEPGKVTAVRDLDLPASASGKKPGIKPVHLPLPPVPTAPPGTKAFERQWKAINKGGGNGKKPALRGGTN